MSDDQLHNLIVHNAAQYVQKVVINLQELNSVLMTTSTPLSSFEKSRALSARFKLDCSSRFAAEAKFHLQQL
jgi:hypothetical protein